MFLFVTVQIDDFAENTADIRNRDQVGLFVIFVDCIRLFISGIYIMDIHLSAVCRSLTGKIDVIKLII